MTFNTLISVQASENKNTRVVFKFNPQDFNLDWQKGDVIRVISKKNSNFVRLVKSSKKHKKQVAFILTSTGSGDFSFNQGLFIPHTQRRFSMAPSTSRQLKSCAFSLDKKSIIIPIPVEE